MTKSRPDLDSPQSESAQSTKPSKIRQQRTLQDELAASGPTNLYGWMPDNDDSRVSLWRGPDGSTIDIHLFCSTQRSDSGDEAALPLSWRLVERRVRLTLPTAGAVMVTIGEPERPWNPDESSEHQDDAHDLARIGAAE